MPSPNELRMFAAEAKQSADEYRLWAEQFPAHREYYLKCARDREADYRFCAAKADMDEAWLGTEDYTLEAAE